MVGAAAVGVGYGVTGTGGAATRHLPSSYCAAARAYDDVRHPDPEQRAALLRQIAALAPHDIVPTVRTLRMSPTGSSRHVAALQAWNRFNTNHCCGCIGGPSVPQVLSHRPMT